MMLSKHRNYRVEIEPHRPFLFEQSHDAMRLALEDLEAQAKRHLDGVNNIRTAFDTYIECSFCGYEPEPGEFPNLPNCCHAAQIEWVAEHMDFEAPASWDLSDVDWLRELKLRVAFPEATQTTDERPLDGTTEGTA